MHFFIKVVRSKRIGYPVLSLLVILSLLGAPCFAQNPAEEAPSKPKEELTPAEKLVMWTFPRFSDVQVNDFILQVEMLASKYRVDFNLALATVCAEASFPGLVANARKGNIDIAKLLSGRRIAGYPPVEYDLENAISTLSELFRTENSTAEALEIYWADEASGYNADTVGEFTRRVMEKYSALKSPSGKKKEEYVREFEGFPPSPSELEQFTVKSDLYKELVRYDVEDSYKEVAKYFNPNLTEREATIIARSVLTFSTKSKIVDPRLVMAVIAAESRFRPQAVSNKGALGLGQLMPATARSHGIENPFDPVQNIYVTVKYLEREIKRWKEFGQWLDLVLASYNAGPEAVKKYGGVPPYSETRSFIEVVKRYYRMFTE